jgi:hypothetical protein
MDRLPRRACAGLRGSRFKLRLISMVSSECEHWAVLVLMAVVTDVGVGVGADEDAGDGASQEAASLACKLVYHQRECLD